MASSLRLLRHVAMVVVWGVMGTAPGHAEDLLTSQMVDEARMWQSKGRMDLAEDIWRRLLITDARNGAALVGLAQIQIKAGRIAEAQALLARAARLTPPPAGLATASAQLRAAQQNAPAPVAAAPGERKDVPVAQGAGADKAPASSKGRTPSTAPPVPPPTAAKAAVGPAPGKTASPPSPAPVPPRPAEVTVTPIPFRTVEAAPARGDDEGSGPLRLQPSSQLLLGASTPAPGTSDAPKAAQKNKPRPCRPAPATNPPLPER